MHNAGALFCIASRKSFWRVLCKAKSTIRHHQANGIVLSFCCLLDASVRFFIDAAGRNCGRRKTRQRPVKRVKSRSGTIADKAPHLHTIWRLMGFNGSRSIGLNRLHLIRQSQRSKKKKKQKWKGVSSGNRDLHRLHRCAR